MKFRGREEPRRAAFFSLGRARGPRVGRDCRFPALEPCRGPGTRRGPLRTRRLKLTSRFTLRPGVVVRSLREYGSIDAKKPAAPRACSINDHGRIIVLVILRLYDVTGTPKQIVCGTFVVKYFSSSSGRDPRFSKAPRTLEALSPPSGTRVRCHCAGSGLSLSRADAIAPELIHLRFSSRFFN